ncbi:hypothetical protein JYT72_01645 [Crocinitomix catalasitica]|nr:hypothetical protein [Crocinitomix catalasitica]
MKKKEELIETDSAIICLGNDGIVRPVYKPGAIISRNDIEQNMSIVQQIGGEGCFVLVDITNVLKMTREARAYYSSDEPATFLDTVALLTGSLTSRVIGNFMIGINKPKFRVKMFNDHRKALEWLKDQKA